MSGAPHIIRVKNHDIPWPTSEISSRIRDIFVDGRSWTGSVGITKHYKKPTEILLDHNRCWDETHLYVDDTLLAIDYGILHDLPLHFEPDPLRPAKVSR